MTTLESIKKYSIIVADTGDLEAIKTFSPADATTNPSLVLKVAEQGKLDKLLEQEKTRLKKDKNYSISEATESLSVNLGSRIANLIPGYISTEVDARLSYDIEKMIVSGNRIISKYKELGIDSSRVLVKLASTWEGIQACQELEKNHIQCNLTLLFCEVQAAAAANAHATLISPFVGRIYDWHKKNFKLKSTYKQDPGVESVKRIYEMYKQCNIKTIVMGASFRNVNQIISLAGCDRLTISPSLLQELSNSDFLVKPILVEKLNRKLDNVTQSDFLLSMAKNPMATEKLSEGITKFIEDQEKLEKLLQ